jgi:thioredoxin reductase (NADPH)
MGQTETSPHWQTSAQATSTAHCGHRQQGDSVNRTTTVAVVGGGAAGLTAALFLQRGGVATEVFDQDRSILKRARLQNLPGAHDLEGRELLTQLRTELSERNVPITNTKVDDVVPTADTFQVMSGGDTVEAQFIVLASGQGTIKLASLNVAITDARQPFVKVNVITDHWGATSVPGVWAAGVAAGWPSQAVVCAGSGANVAIEIISRIKGEFWVDHDDSRLGADPE